MKKSILLCFVMALICITQPISAFAFESIAKENTFVELGVTDDGIPYIVTETVVEVPATAPSMAPISVFVTRNVRYGSFNTRAAAEAFNGYPSYITHTEDIGGATLATGRLNFKRKEYEQHPISWFVVIVYEGYITAQS